MSMPARTLIVLAITLAAAVAAADFEFAAYAPCSIEDAFANAHADPDVDYMIEAANIKYEVVATWTGGHRTITAAPSKVVHNWATSVQRKPELAALFEHEIEVAARGRTYWLPIQSTLIQPFVEEVRQGSQVRLFIMYVGARATDKIFILNEFQAIAADPADLAE